MKKKHTLRNIIIVLCIAAAAGVVIWYFYQNNMKQPVKAYAVTSLNSPYWNEERTYSATVTDGALQNIELREGLVNSIEVSLGDKVKKGDVVMTYDKTSLNLTIQSDESLIALLESQINKAMREAEKYRSLQPSENMPEGWEEVIDLGPLVVKDTLTSADITEDFQTFNCTINSVLTKDFLTTLRDREYSAVIDLYEGNFTYGSLFIDGFEIPSTIEEFVPYDLPVPTITPEPEPIPTVTPEPEPTVTPEPEPTVSPEPEPTVSPEPGPTVSPEPGPTVSPEPEPTGSPEPTIGPEPTEEPEPTIGPDPAIGNDGLGKKPKRPSDSDIEPEPTPQLYILVETEVEIDDWHISDIVSFNGEEAEQKPDPDEKYYCIFEPCELTEYEQYEIEYHDTDEDYGDNYLYSREELAQMAQEADKNAARLTLELNEAKVTYEQDKRIAQSGDVVAGIDGTVTELKNPDECATGDTIMKIKGEEDYIITVYVSEMELRDVKPGDEYNITAYESGNMFTTSVTEIGTDPATGGYYSNGDSNPNNSYYPVSTVAKDKGLELSVGEMCEATAVSENEQASDALFIPIMFTRNDSRGTYVMKDVDGALKKEYVRTGKIIWGYEIEIRSGVKLYDYIAFPYGKTVSEGSPADRTDSLDIY